MSNVKKNPGKDDSYYLDTPQPDWLVNFINHPTDKLDLSVIYQAEKYWKVDLTVTDSGMPPYHRHWLTKYCLAKTTTLRELNLEGCNIGDAGLDELAEILIENISLRKINLKNNFISAKKAARFLDVLEEHNVTLSSVEIDEGEKDAIEKNKYQHDSFDLGTVTSMLQANESEQDQFVEIKRRLGKLNSFNKRIVLCLDDKNPELEMIFHGDRGRSSGNKLVELKNEKISMIFNKVQHITILTIEKWYPYVPSEGDRKWYDNLDPTIKKRREENDKIPDAIFQLKNLQELNFFDCIDSTGSTFFRYVPNEITNLTNLKKLTISHCGLKSLDTDPGTTFFSSHDNLQRSIFFKLPNLEILSVPANELKTIPEAIGFCSNLRSLRIYNNKIDELPFSILNLTKLKELICFGNKLRKIPISLTKYCIELNDLRILNQEEDIKKKVSLIAADEKNLGKIRDAESKQSRDQPFNLTIAYLSKFISSTPRIRLNRCKLMFVGDGAVGKTTTIKSLQNLVEKSKKQRQNVLDNVATDGIDMHTIRIPAGFKHTPGHIGGSECINFSCWDFAGQDVYTYTHQFFLSEKAVYLIGFNVENAIRPDGDVLNMMRVDYWLQSISHRFPESPIIIFGTHIDGKATKEQLKSLHKQLTDKYVKNKKLKVVKVVFISNENGKGTKDLLDEIKSVCKGKKFAPVLGIEKEYPLHWLFLEEKGKSIGGLRVMPIISFKEWQDIAMNQVGGFNNENSLKEATQFLHDTGSLVWFNEEGLSDIVCLRPDFLAEVFAAVISAKTGLGTGILKHEVLLQIWKGFPIYLYPYMLALLEKFEITHRLEGDAINNTAISNNLLTEHISNASHLCGRI